MFSVSKEEANKKKKYKTVLAFVKIQPTESFLSESADVMKVKDRTSVYERHGSVAQEIDSDSQERGQKLAYYDKGDDVP